MDVHNVCTLPTESRKGWKGPPVCVCVPQSE